MTTTRITQSSVLLSTAGFLPGAGLLDSGAEAAHPQGHDDRPCGELADGAGAGRAVGDSRAEVRVVEDAVVGDQPRMLVSRPALAGGHCWSSCTKRRAASATVVSLMSHSVRSTELLPYSTTTASRSSLSCSS